MIHKPKYSFLLLDQFNSYSNGIAICNFTPATTEKFNVYVYLKKYFLEK